MITGGMVPDYMIREKGIIDPCHEKYKCGGVSCGLSSYGYDLTLGSEFVLSGTTDEVRYTEIEVPSKRFVKGHTYEYIRMPDNYVGFIFDKSTWARRGLQAFNTVIEPGWEGQITLEFVNCSERSILLEEGQGIVQIMFQECHLCEQPYSGKYQHQTGVTPAIWKNDG